MTTLRDATLDDGPDIAQVEAAAAAHPWSPEQVERHLHQASGHGVVALVGDRVVGHVLYQAVCDQGEVHSVAVHPEHQRRGIASRLLAHVDGALRSLGCAEAWLEVRRDNVAACGAYRRAGWSEHGVRPRYYRDDCDALLFRRELA